MSLRPRPATGVLISPAEQKTLLADVEGHLFARLLDTPLSEPEAKLLAARFPIRASGGEVLTHELESWLLEELESKLAQDATCYFGDSDYYLPTENDVRGMWLASELNKLRAIPQRFDCDDFAFAFKGYASCSAYWRGDWRYCGICLGFVSGEFGWAGGKHAANLVVEYRPAAAIIRFVEPMNGSFHELAECDKIFHLAI